MPGSAVVFKVGAALWPLTVGMCCLAWKVRERWPMMPGSQNSNLKDPEMYEELRKDGASKQKAARISNAAAARGRSAVGRKGGESGDYDVWTVPELRAKAKEIGLKGYSGKRKSELIEALRNS